ncbi:4-carboxy-4-hydroxy-2-oxoadipate aldolase/oxaloacetate decarboxylase [Paraburkholderia sp. BCC1885]|uniref:4-carboxy-4-hydroxy-2-oxoadipate aldolase/oxaloacetate decarboxylase n=1 Tax=Paraburkholderia sp. BCC1885 TaxID=2562669 RepID=UPI001181E09C|nr:4-carboxy-4-hydroxy-2-oxoadipate aldolase/oxaloacetate decarboxylase [Paraburkholderia sp. BCC1885]
MSTGPKAPGGQTIQPTIERVSPDIVQAARALPASTLHESGGRIGALPAAIKPIDVAFRICGTAVTVHGPSGDNLWLHRAIYVAQPGEVLVAHVSGGYDFGYWGEIMSSAARERGLAGLVIDGCVRDGGVLPEVGFPVFARGLSMRGTGKDYGAVGWINFPILMGDVVVAAGDLIVGDTDGIVALPRARAPAIVNSAAEREAKESEILRRLASGERTLEIYQF